MRTELSKMLHLMCGKSFLPVLENVILLPLLNLNWSTIYLKIATSTSEQFVEYCAIQNMYSMLFYLIGRRMAASSWRGLSQLCSRLCYTRIATCASHFCKCSICTYNYNPFVHLIFTFVVVNSIISDNLCKNIKICVWNNSWLETNLPLLLYYPACWDLYF